MTRPRATYRLQFRNGMDFDRAVGIVPYLQKLGVSHLYASPIFTAVSGSTHGYDVTDHNEIDPTLGGREGFDRLSAALKEAGLGLILDIVPNHMAASLENPWWRDVVRWGQGSPFQRHFDIDWSERLTLPILGKSLEDALGDGELKLELAREEGGLVLSYFDARLPLSPPTWGAVLSRCDGPLSGELARLAATARPGSETFDNDIQSLLADGDALAQLERQLAHVSQDAGLVGRIHGKQPWRLVFWKEARRHLSYRRFFEVTGLAGVRVEDPPVFDDVHRLILDLVRSGHVDGLRVDHVDGLADPKAYLDRLRQETGPDVYIVVEKILAKDEPLPRDWPVEGTTGYEFIATMADLLTDGEGLGALHEAYAALGGRVDLEAEKRKAKRRMVSENFETELSALSVLAAEIAGESDQSAIATDDIRAAIVDLVVEFSVYRTYGTVQGLDDNDRELLGRIADEARSHGGSSNPLAQAFVLDLLTGDAAPPGTAKANEFLTRFQQLTGPVMAKSVEDTLFYRCNTLIALNEVGGDPAELGSAEAAHARLASGHGGTAPLLATATHDTKRGEDARARLYAISEAPDRWSAAVDRWREINADQVQQLGGGPAPDPDTEWLLYQALAGMWPSTGGVDTLSLDEMSTRFQAYVEKALREAKLRTDWADVDEPYEAAVKAYAQRLLDAGNRRFLDDFTTTLQPFIRAGSVNSLSQTLLKLTAPGIPDIYQGTETADFSLVDPDNRRVPDFAALDRQLGAAKPVTASGLLDGSSKQQLVAKCLAFRRNRDELFARGTYVPLVVSGTRSSDLFAYLRRHGDEQAIVVVPRRVLAMCQEHGLENSEVFWSDTQVHVPAEHRGSILSSVFTGTQVQGETVLMAGDLLRDLPVALLVSVPGAD